MLFIGGPASGREFDVPSFVNLFLIMEDPNGVVYAVEPNQVHVKGTKQHRYVRYTIESKVGAIPIKIISFIHDSLTTESVESVATMYHEVTDGE